MTTYAFTVAGHLDDHWAAWLGGATLVRNADRTTTLAVTVPDQARLHGVLDHLRDISATLLSVTSTPTEPVLTHPLTTERLRLRAAVPDDADLTWPFRRLEAVDRWTSGAPADADAHREEFSRPDSLYATVIVEHPDFGVIGDLMLRVRDAWAQRPRVAEARSVEAELGWFLDPSHSGHGYATESVRELIRYSFEDLGLRRLTAICFLANTPSWTLMERLGMRRESHSVRDSLHSSGEWLDSLTYALLADEWAAGRPIGRPGDGELGRRIGRR